MYPLLPQRSEKRDFYPLTQNQLGVYIGCEKEPDSLIYNLPFFLEFNPQTDAGRLHEAFRRVIEAHPYVKTRLARKDGEIVQTRRDSDPVEISIQECSEEVFMERKRRFARPFDLFGESLYRIEIFKTPGNLYVLLDFHHLIFDGFSATLLLRDLVAAYKNEELTAEDFTAFDHAAAEREELSGNAFEAAKQFFLQKLGGQKLGDGENATSLYPDKAGENGITRYASRMMDRARCKNTAKVLGVSYTNMFLAAVSLVLSRFARTNNVRFATVRNGRSDAHLQNCFGMFVKTLPAVFDVAPQQTVTEFVQQTQAAMLEILAHQAFPYVNIVSDFGFRPQILFAFQGGINTEQEMEGQNISLRELTGGIQKFSIDLKVWEAGMNYRLTAEYDGAQFHESTITALIECIAHVAENLADWRDLRLEELSVKSPAQAERVAAFSGSIADTGGDTVVSLFEKQVAETPDAIALIATDATLTYAELNARANRLANELIRHGIKVEDKVAFVLHRDSRATVATYGILKAGAAFIPIDPEFPLGRITHYVTDSEAKFTLTDHRYKQDYTNSLDIDDLLAEGMNEANPNLPLTERNLFCILYTSGSTGIPKGAQLEHRGLVSFSRNSPENICIAKALEMQANVACISTLSFDASLIAPLTCHINGKCHILASDEESKNPIPMAELFQRTKTECLFSTNTRMMDYLDSPELQKAIADVKIIMLGGEKFTAANYEKLRRYTNALILNGYGPTETCIFSNNRIMTDPQNLTVGKPLFNVVEIITDNAGQPLPIGAVGELWIGGPRVSRGYLNRPELNAERFVERDGIPFYKTGDLAKWTDDGEVLILGRNDNQVKLRGLRIELGEIESALSAVAGIKQCAVLVRKDRGQDRLCAWFTADRAISAGELQDALSKNLTDYMVPTAYMQLAEMPHTPNGKLDTKALPQIEYHAGPIKEPSTDLQHLIARIAAEIIGIPDEELSVDASLVAAGMSSLSAIKIAAQLSRETSRTVTGQQILKARTIEAVESAILASGSVDAVRHSEINRQYCPLSQSQLGVYLHCAKDPQTTQYNMPFVLVFERENDSISPERLRQAWLDTVNAHPILKTHLAMHGRELVQVLDDNRNLDVPLERCAEEEIAGIMEGFCRPFNLFEGPFARAAIYVSEKAIRLLLDFHHLVFDGASVEIFLTELADAYQGAESKSREAADEWTAQDATAAERAFEQSPQYEEAAAFFKEQLSKADEPTSIPRDRQTEEPGAPMGIAAFRVDRESVRRYCQERDLTPAGFFLGVLAMVVSGFANRKDLLLFAISSGRDDLRRQRTIGMLVKTIPVVISVEPDSPVFDFLTECQRKFFDSIARQDYPFPKLAGDYKLKPQIMYAFQGGLLGGRYSFAGQCPAFEMMGRLSAKFPLSVHVNDEPDAFRVEFQYDSSLYDTETMQTFGTSFADVALRLAGQSPDDWIAVRDVRLLTAKQQAELREIAGSITENPVPNLFSLLESQAKTKGESPALLADDRELAFGELNAEANKLAHGLLARGLAKGDRVAFLLPRDSRLLVAMFGILKAGGVYIPIDPEYPTGRIRQILSDSDARFVLTDGERGDLENALPFDAVPIQGATENPGVSVSPDDTAYMIYTSGSTGRPKGVVLTHRGIVNYVLPREANRHVMALLREDCRMLSVTTVSFDMFLKEAFTVLMNGLTLVLANTEQTRNPRELAALFKATDANAFNATPSRLALYLEDAELLNALQSCRVIMAGGESYPASLYHRLRQAAPHAVLINTYGPTEITVSSNAKILDGSAITIGAPLWNVVESVRDFCGRELPMGVTGELWIGGEGVAQGYHGLEKLTRERFITVDGLRYYKSGDRAKWNQQGEIIHLGRGDRQVKLRGLRIELEEIEAALKSAPGIKTAFVQVREIDGREHLAAWYQPEIAPPEPTPTNLRDHVAVMLPVYMLPTAWGRLDAIPMTPNGKVDYEKLPQPQLMERKEYEPPGNETERQFQEIFADILKLDKISVLDGFFDLGGSSLLVTRVLSAAQSLGFPLNYGDVFQKTTPRELAELVQNRLGDSQQKQHSGTADVSRASRDSEGFDYAGIDDLLARNTIASFRQGVPQPIGNMLLTGATGFLGIHVLKEFLDRENGIAYCLIRGTNPAQRLKNLLHFYFDSTFEELFGLRIVVLEGDIENAETLDKIKRFPIDTVMNCAANVKHFSAGSDIEDVNLGGVQHLLEFCRTIGARLIHVSTTSVAGVSIDDSPPPSMLMNEQMLWFGQNVENQYVGSKFRAERLALAAMAAEPENAAVKIMRVGNLMGRHKDGEFQINSNSNSYIGRLRAYKQIGSVPYDFLTIPTELAPVDCTAEAILALARTPKECCVFHPYNDHFIFIGDVLDAMNRLGYNIQSVEPEEFDKAVRLALQDERKAEHLTSMIAYMNRAQGQRTAVLKTENTYTSQILRRLGFHWPITTDEYLDRFIAGLDSLGFFD
ncbi:MAG: amino acid adenylation domain-containing protein [Planctomycetaceae bacterium]|nr:amino acid adenylation domain-containing protein [Planctomycetaceae bacterium]